MSAELDAEIDQLTVRLHQLAPGSTDHHETCAMLAEAHLERAVEDDAPGDLDLAIELGERLSGHDDDMPVRFTLANAYQYRWADRDDPADRDRAIDCWRRVLAEVPHPAGFAECGQLLGERGEAAGDRADVSASIAMLEQAVAGGEPVCWPLGLAYRLRWQLDGDPSDLAHAVRDLDRGLEPTLPPEWLVLAHIERLDLTRQLVEAESADDPVHVPPSSTVLLRQMDEARAAWSGGAGDHEDRIRLAAAMMVSAIAAWPFHLDVVDTGWIRELAAFGRTLPDPPPEWSRALAVFESLGRFVDQARSGVHLPEEGIDLLLEPLRDDAADPGEQSDLRNMATLFMATQAIRRGDRRLLREAIDRLSASADPEVHRLGRTFDLADRAQQGDPAVRDDLAALLAEIRGNPPSFLARQSYVAFLAMIESMFTGIDGRYRPVDHTPVPPGDVTAADHALRALLGPTLAAICRHDVATLRECADRVDMLLAVYPPGHVLRLMALGLGGTIGTAVLRDEPGDQDAARRVLDWTADGLDLTGGPHHPRWTSFALARAEALRHVTGGDRADARRWGLAGLRGFAWQVMLQAGTDDAVVVASDVTAVARRVAGWCQSDGAVDDLVAALDAGRGTVLHAATVSRTVADRLTEAGHPDLAAEWLASAGQGRDRLTGDPVSETAHLTSGAEPDGPWFRVPDDLRARVLSVLDLSAPEPVSPAELRAGLAAVDADALVYLVPSGEESPGAAVIVPATGETTMLVLPGLFAGPGSALAGHTARVRGARAAEPASRVGARDAGPAFQVRGARAAEPASRAGAGDAGSAFQVRGARAAEPASRVGAGDAGPAFQVRGARDAGPVDGVDDPVASTLDDLCRWAWSAAMEPLLHRAGITRADGPLRLVLVPMGALSPVPWHAAFRADGDQRHYAVQEAIFSYAVSGRAFAESARAAARTVKSVLIVGDPTGDLPSAGLEAKAVGEAFYPRATFLGAGGELGTPRRVLDWITAAAPGPSLLHLACHGRADPAHPADAALRLAGGELTARRLLDASRTADLRIEQVYLAACTTGRPGADHDEAFSLTTAFLAAGARTGFGSLWAVPDEQTSVLMFLVHHHLNTGGCTPAEALHQAQLWMLDPHRKPPSGMPPELARSCSGPHMADPIAWAAFTHHGR
ncbi:CHAT domain-containing protein [Actinoplanes sp. NPDC049265]|uniref:CHAT domain-containing protein n=1 Tax=Actinoplanes sp. NPDC049265 TaxID=3363902 RepID=UPI003711D82E